MINTKISWFICFADDLKNENRYEKQNIALKLNCKFSHPSAQKLYHYRRMPMLIIINQWQ